MKGVIWSQDLPAAINSFPSGSAASCGLKIQGKIRRKRLSLPGTGGQCLLDPPAMDGGRFPAVLYNLGGGLANLIFAAVACVLAFAIGTVAAKVILLPPLPLSASIWES